MASASSTTAAKLILFLHATYCCEAMSSVGMASGPVTWTGSLPLVRSPDDTCDLASFMFTGTELQRPSSSVGAVTTEEVKTTAAATEEAPQECVQGEECGWEASFAAGVYESKKALEAEDLDASSWVGDSSSGGAVPSRMLKAEVLLQAAEQATPEKWKEKTAERALRVYYHAKWLAERNYARAAEHRYHEAANLARSCRRSVLASHSLARLGYFLVHWKRSAEAAEVLQESMKLNKKSNPLAPYLHGVLERKVAGGDVDRLRDAEELIVNAGEQPSEELEAERGRLIDEISYWREAEGSSRHCAASNDVAYVLICFFGHVVAFLRQVLVK